MLAQSEMPDLQNSGSSATALHSLHRIRILIDFQIYILFIYGIGVEPSPLLLGPFIGPLYQSWMTDGDDCEAISGMKNGVFWVVTPCEDTILHSHRRENLKSYN
jgi:hypothetical protein